jgi:urate oxidase
MNFSLRDHQYGKAETRLVHVDRQGDRHEIADLTVTVTLRGDFGAAYLEGDNSHVLPTDTQKNTVFAYARQGIGEIEDFALRLASHFVDDVERVRRARVAIERHAWERIPVDGTPHGHAFARAGEERRLTTVTSVPGTAWVVSGLTGLVLLKSTGSEFAGFLRDRYTTLEETADRILATAVDARWRYATREIDWAAAHATARQAMVEAFARVHSLALQQTLYEMGRAALEAVPEIAEVRLSLPNKHHFLVDLAPFGEDNPNQVFHAADRPYGLIEGTVCRDGAPDPGQAW